MDFNSYDFRRIVTLCPEFLSTASASTLIPVFTFLLREASVQPFNIREVIRRRPKLLLCSVDNQLRPTLRFLQTIGISTAFKHTYLLSCSVEGMLVPRIRYFQDLGFSYRESASMLKRFPQLFSYNLKENIEPKLEYYVEEMGRDLKELKEFPQYFSYSLENRTKPRHLSCVERGVCMPLAVMLRTNDSHFRQRLESFSDESLLPVSSSPLSRVESDDPVIDTQET
ncbi:Transcription termination factor MTEF1, chloroplastic [Linum perenne]